MFANQSRFRVGLAVLSSVAGLLLAAYPHTAAAADRIPARQTGQHSDEIRPHNRTGTTANSGTGSLAFGGGSVDRVPSVYVTYWGAEWQNGFSTGGFSSSQAQNYINTFFQNVGGSYWINSRTEYCEGVATGSTWCAPGSSFITNPTSQLLGTWVDTGNPVPASPTGSDITNEAGRAQSHFGYRAGAIYVVITPHGKSQSGFGTNFCAWHGFNSSIGMIPYAYIPYMPDAGYACGVNAVNKTNDSFGHGYFDGFSIVGGHEYAESITDPFPSGGWVDSSGAEDADKCQWNSAAPPANTDLGVTFFAVQPLWSNASGGCSYGTTVVPPTLPAPPGNYHAVTPFRILDTRNGTGGHLGQIPAGSSIDVQVAGVGGVPASGAGSAVMNVTAADGTANTHLFVYPSGEARPFASTLNAPVRQTIPNLAEVKLGSNGMITVYNNSGWTDAIIDLDGWVDGVTTGKAGLFKPLVPARVVDTRYGIGGYTGTIAAGQAMEFQITGRGGVPSSGVSAVVMNVTATGGTMNSHFTVFPSGQGIPTASNVNFLAYHDRPNRVEVNVGANGRVSVYNNSGNAYVVIDVNGWYTDGSDSTATGSHFSGITPARIMDSRYGVGGITSRLGQGQTFTLQVAGAAQVPASGATAVVLNVTVTNPSDNSNLQVFPGDANRPLQSDLNFDHGQTVANMVVVKLSSSGTVNLFNYLGVTDVIVDVTGFYS